MNSKVLEQSEEFINCIGEIVDPSRLLFRTFAAHGTKGLSRICKMARNRCTGTPDTAIASLTVNEGSGSSFRIYGAHAIATLVTVNGHSNRLVILLVVIIAILFVVYVVIFRQRGAKKDFDDAVQPWDRS